jgi:hypothetical protein
MMGNETQQKNELLTEMKISIFGKQGKEEFYKSTIFSLFYFWNVELSVRLLKKKKKIKYNLP